MATINFRIEAPITKYETRLSVVENRLVSLIKDFIRDAGQIQGLSVGMSHVEFANGAYFTNVSIKNEWYESARGLKNWHGNMIRIMISVRIRHFLLCMPPTYLRWVKKLCGTSKKL